jgi:hypothetical protein
LSCLRAEYFHTTETKWILFQLNFYEFKIFIVITNTTSKKKKKTKRNTERKKKGIKMAQYKNSTERAVM